MLQVSTEMVVLVFLPLLIGFVAGIGKIMYDVGQIKGAIMAKLDSHEKMLALHGKRLGKLEAGT